MAKEKNGKNRWVVGIISVSLTVICMIIAGVLAYADNSSTGVHNKERIDYNSRSILDVKGTARQETSKLEFDGCKPAQKANTDIQVIYNQLDTIKTNQERNRLENKESFDKILEKLH